MEPTAWTIKAPEWATPTYFLFDWIAFRTRVQAQEYIAVGWTKDDETLSQGWRRAYRKGFRAVRCAVVEVPATPKGSE